MGSSAFLSDDVEHLSGLVALLSDFVYQQFYAHRKFMLGLFELLFLCIADEYAFLFKFLLNALEIGSEITRNLIGLVLLIGELGFEGFDEFVLIVELRLAICKALVQFADGIIECGNFGVYVITVIGIDFTEVEVGFVEKDGDVSHERHGVVDVLLDRL